jgi:hypothetical protein
MLALSARGVAGCAPSAQLRNHALADQPNRASCCSREKPSRACGIATALEAGRNEYVAGGLAGGPGTNLCIWESAAGQPYALIKIRFTQAANVAPASVSYSVDDLGDSAFVDRAFAATTVLVGANAFTVQATGVRETSDEIAAAHPELVAAEGPATTSELQASLAIARALSDRFVAGD